MPRRTLVPAAAIASAGLLLTGCVSDAGGEAVVVDTADAPPGDAIALPAASVDDAVTGALAQLSDLIADAVTAETGITPVLSTSGGTSDARFVKDHCPVVEFGLVGKTMHQVDECVPVAQIDQLKAIYTRILRGYFAA